MDGYLKRNPGSREIPNSTRGRRRSNFPPTHENRRSPAHPISSIGPVLSALQCSSDVSGPLEPRGTTPRHHIVEIGPKVFGFCGSCRWIHVLGHSFLYWVMCCLVWHVQACARVGLTVDGDSGHNHEALTRFSPAVSDSSSCLSVHPAARHGVPTCVDEPWVLTPQQAILRASPFLPLREAWTLRSDHEGAARTVSRTLSKTRTRVVEHTESSLESSDHS